MSETPGVFADLYESLAACPPLAHALAAQEDRHEIGGLWKSSASLAIALLARASPRPGVAVAASAEAAEGLSLDLATLAPALRTALLPVEEEGLPAGGPEQRANRSERLVALESLGTGGAGVLVVPGPVLLEELPALDPERVVLARGERVGLEGLLAQLIEHGFTRVPLVGAPGEMSLRGDILDVYPWAATFPVRIEMFDEEVEDVRHFEVDTQRSVEVLERAVFPLGGGSPGGVRPLWEFLGAHTPVWIVDPPALSDRLAEVAFERGLAPRRIARALERMRSQPGAELYTLDLGRPGADTSIRSVGAEPRSVEQAVAGWHEAGRSVVLLSDSEGESARIAEHLELVPGGRVRLATGRVTAGFAFPGGGPVLVHHHELIGRRPVRRRRPRRVVASRALESVAELASGDHVVHLTHGVAVYRGMERRSRDQGEEDFLVLEFAEETRLFVPASRIDLVERFVGVGERAPKLDRIGGKSWTRKKNQVASAVADLAADLLGVQAARNRGEGFGFPPDDPMQTRFEAAFPYEDTTGQARAWAEIRADMEQRRPMDRLLVGDVGFGKTEVAIRAAYKTVLARKQVAVLVPTTVLAEQHFDTFSRRMAEEAVRVEVLSRFRAGARTSRVLKDLAAGHVDIVIGTHRMLGRDVSFPDLGLVIVDEEQRFGVAHKERLKRLKTTVDVLTLSATPIPRTLHMAMSGLRDISSIQTPPPGRRPVITHVGYDDDDALGGPIQREVRRGGQAYVLHNRVQTIGRTLERVRSLVPTARVASAHGQMPSAQLQAVVEEFARGDIDVLVCTTIIQSGVDIPRVNTLVATDAHRFGLADLHQLRGRVGRESRQAYAYFLVPRQPLPGPAQRRLKAIEEFTSLGSGLPIALHDLELRGAGNLLGPEQSGHILAVGYDMYCRLLRAAVKRQQGQTVHDEPGEIEVELGITAYLSTRYVPMESVRMGLLRRLAHADAGGIDTIERELADRFGRPPEPTQALLDLFRLRSLVRAAGVGSVLADGLGGVVLTVANETTYGRRGPFAPPEAFALDTRRMRIPWPDGVQTPHDRLRYLLRRFRHPPATVKTQ